MSDSVASLLARSRASLLFEAVLFEARRSGPVPRTADIEFSRIGRYVPWIATIEPDLQARTLKITHLGPRLAKLMGRENNFIGLDYLAMVDPSIKDGAFDSVVEMMQRPCGLWQVTPAVAASGAPIAFEYTGYPVIADSGRIQIMFLIYHPSVTRTDRDALPRPAQMQHSEVWSWISMREHATA